MTFMLRVQVGDNHVRHTGIAWQDFEEPLQCFQPTCRRADPHDRNFVVLRGMKVHFVCLSRFALGSGGLVRLFFVCSRHLFVVKGYFLKA
jgi:hypothetical protein